MADTRISDIIIPDVFNPYVTERTAEKSALFQSGIVAVNDRVNSLVANGGKIIQMPEFADLGNADSEVLSDSSALTLNNISTQQMDAHVIQRGKAWGVNDLAAAMSGADPMAAIGDLVSDYWMRDQQRVLVNTLNGVFGSALAATHVASAFDESGNDATAAQKVNVENIINAFALLGDELDSLSAIVMHSVPYYNLLKNNVIEFVSGDATDQRGAVSAAAQIPTILGRRVIVDDNVATRAGTTNGTVYSTYLFGAGAIGFGQAPAPVPTETDRDSLAGVDVLINRQHYVLHPMGLSFAPAAGGALAGQTPTNAELATAGKWSKVWEDKNIHIVELKTNG